MAKKSRIIFSVEKDVNSVLNTVANATSAGIIFFLISRAVAR